MEVANINERFLEYKPLLWRVLGRLARDGYVIQPQDAHDFIQDFYLEWHPLNERFDAQKGDFAPYLVASFYRFCRRRFLQLQRLRARTVDIEELAGLPGPDTPIPEAAEWKEQIARLKVHIATLPSEERQLLEALLSDETFGERALAQRFRLTRYGLREVLARAVSRVALQMCAGEPATGDAAVAVRLWLEGKTPRKVARELGLSTGQVQLAKQRFAQALLASIRPVGRTSSKEGIIMSGNFELLRQVLNKVGDAAALGQLRSQCAEVRAALDEGDFLLSKEEGRLLAENPEWLGEVYRVLAGDEGGPEPDLALEAALADEHAEIAAAWEVLLEKLDGTRLAAGPSPWEQALEGIVESDQDYLAHLRVQTSVERGGAAAQRLLRYGLTPYILFDALRNMELLFKRTWRRKAATRAAELPPHPAITLRDQSVRTAIAPELLYAQMGGTFDLQEKAIEPLVECIFCLLEMSPLLVEGYRYEGDRTFRSLAREPEAQRMQQLPARWAAGWREVPETVN